MDLIKDSVNYTLDQLKVCIQQMDENSYTSEIELLSGNAIGKHARHIIELFQCLLDQSESNTTVNYDERVHSRIIETSVVLSLNAINDIKVKIAAVTSDKPLQLVSSSDVDGGVFVSDTSLSRELQYNVEHAIHHMAIIQIAIRQCFKMIALPNNFGVAYSTIQFQTNQ
jgi:hypothetical protein